MEPLMDVILKNMLQVAAMKAVDKLNLKYAMIERSSPFYTTKSCLIVYKGYGDTQEGEEDYFPKYVWIIEVSEEDEGRIHTKLSGPFEDSDDDYWLEQREHDNDRAHLVTQDWYHFLVRPDGEEPVGYEGQEFKFRLRSTNLYLNLKDAGLNVERNVERQYVLTTRNLWSQGIIPPKHRHLWVPNCL
jgi:hypothetical protein